VSIPWSRVEGLDIDADEGLEDLTTGGRGMSGRGGQKKLAMILKVRIPGGDRVRFCTLSMSPEELRTVLAPLLQAMDSQQRVAWSVPTNTAESEPAAAAGPQQPA
jgi:hypothetical protein